MLLHTNWRLTMTRFLVGALFLLLCTLSVAVNAKSASAASLASSLPCPPTIQQGSSGTWVKALQYRLNYEYNWNSHYGDPYGFPNSPYNFHPLLSVDGQFGQNTYNAVRDFQAYHSLSVDGSVGNNTWSELGMCNSGPHTGIESGAFSTSCPSSLQQGASGTWVQVLQSRLDTLYLLGEFGNSPYNFSPLLGVDGQFGQNTRNAVLDYQAYWNQNDSSVSVDGNVGPQTWGLLGFC